MIITSYSDFNKSLDECPKSLKGKKMRRWIYNNLQNRDKGRFSIFEATENLRVARILTRMIHIQRYNY